MTCWNERLSRSGVTIDNEQEYKWMTVPRHKLGGMCSKPPSWTFLFKLLVFFGAEMSTIIWTGLQFFQLVSVSKGPGAPDRPCRYQRTSSPGELVDAKGHGYNLFYNCRRAVNCAVLILMSRLRQTYIVSTVGLQTIPGKQAVSYSFR